MIKFNKRIRKTYLKVATKFLLSVFVSSFVKIVFVVTVIAVRTFFRIKGGKSVEKLLDVTTCKLSSLS